MHPFHRLSHYVKSCKSFSSPKKERSSMDNSDKQFDPDEGEDECCHKYRNKRAVSPSKKKMVCETDYTDVYYDKNIPVVRIESDETATRETKKNSSILKAKEKLLWTNSSTEWDNQERLGPNKNSIIQESMRGETK